jgi:hypothetical protein
MSNDGSLAIPPALLAEIEAEAEKEHRSAVDVLQDAVTRYVREKRRQKIHAKGADSAKTLGLTEDDIPRLIADTRKELRQGRE